MDDLCAGKIPMMPLYCYWHTNDDPYLIIGPVKAEILSISPRIIRFHEVYSDEEIEKLKEISLREFSSLEIVLRNSFLKVI